MDRMGSQPSMALTINKEQFLLQKSKRCYVSTMTFSLAYCELVTLLVTVGQLRPRLAAFDNVCQVQTTKEF